MSEKQNATTAVPLSVPDGGAPAVPMHLQEKQGAKCCGCCCDYRRAVYIIAIVYIILNLLYIVASLGAFVIPGSEIWYDDDEVVAYFDDGLKISLILSGINVVATTCALIGAMKFNKYLVGVNIVWIIVSYIADIILSINAKCY